VTLAKEIDPAGAGGDGEEPRQQGADGGRRRLNRRRRWALAAVLLAWLGAGIYGVTSYGHNYYRFRGFPAPRTPRGVPAGKVVKVKFFSPALGKERSYLIYLPPGYSAAAANGRRFPTYYFLHGSPGWPSLVLDAGHLAVDADVLLNQHRIRPMLMVMPDGRNGTFLSDTEWANTRHGKYDSFVLDVVRAVDSRWATVPKRAGRALAGNSEGAYASLNLTLRHLNTFSVAESWSGYVKPTVKNGPFAGEPKALVAANDPALYLASVASQLRRLSVHAYIYTGRRDHSAPQVIDFARRMRLAGGDVTMSLFPGGHNWRVWHAHAPLMLEYASKWLAR
jgi:enterochelin esterase-like enzyme